MKLKQETRVWTVRDLMKVCIDLLQKKGIDEARLNVELLLAHALQCPRINLYTNFDKPLSKEELRSFRSLFERRLNREPVQYIIGSTGFMGLQFTVDPRVLIPRPETETLVEQAMLVWRHSQDQPLTILDIGTGSGNIAVSLAKFCKNCSVIALDLTDETLEVARINAERNSVSDRITFVKMDVFEPVDQLLLRRFDLLVSNPPYVSKVEYETVSMEIRRFEPKEAVSDGSDGLEFYRRLVELSPYLLIDGGTIIAELGFGQEQAISEMMHNADFHYITVVPDLQGVPRVISAKVRAKTRNPGPEYGIN